MRRLGPALTWELGTTDACAAKPDDELPPWRFSLDSVTTELRVDRMIFECRALGIEPDARTIAEIMVDDDVTVGRYEDYSDEWTVAFETYERVAARTLASERRSRKKA
jgi:hypothetical protein